MNTARKTYIFVGAKLPEGKLGNPGGQLTASIGLKSYAEEQDYDFVIVDTTQSSFPEPTFTTRLRKGLSRLIDVNSLLRSRPVDGVIIFSAHGFSFFERTFIALICRLYKVNSIFFMRSGFFIKEINSSSVKRFLARYFLRFPTKIGIQGDSWSKFFNDLGVFSNRLVTVRNWLPDHIIPASNPITMNGDIVNFCYVGWLVKEKGIIELLDAIKLLSKYTDRFTLTLVGGGDLELYVEEFIRANELDARVLVAGWCDSPTVVRYLSQSHVFVLPSHAEGFPNSLLEAMAYAMPAICTDVGAIKDSLLHNVNGFIVPVNSSHEICKSMLSYIENPSLVAKHSVESLKIISTLHGKRQNCEKVFSALSKF